MHDVVLWNEAPQLLDLSYAADMPVNADLAAHGPAGMVHA